MTIHPNLPARVLLLAACSLLLLPLYGPLSRVHAQATPSQQSKPAPPPPDDAGPATDNGSIILKKKKEAEEPPPPPPTAPAEPKVKNPNGETYSLRVDVPIVNIDANVILDKTHQ